MCPERKRFLKQELLNEARSWVGTKFRHQGRSKKTINQPGAVDCIGLIVGIAKNLCLKNKHNELIYTYDESNYSRLGNNKNLENLLNTHLFKVDNYEECDILLFSIMKRPQHVAIVGNETMIHSYQNLSIKGEVIEHELSNNWKKRIIGIYRWPQLL